MPRRDGSTSFTVGSPPLIKQSGCLVDTFESVDIVGPQWRMADAGFVRPTATWTYMVHDNPLGDTVGMGVGFARKYLRRSA
jgi:hypothetical protein